MLLPISGAWRSSWYSSSLTSGASKSVLTLLPNGALMVAKLDCGLCLVVP